LGGVVCLLALAGWGQSNPPRDDLAALQEARPEPRESSQILALLAGRPMDFAGHVNDVQPREVAGDKRSFWIAVGSPRRHVKVEARLQLVTRHAYWYVQDAVSSDDSALRSSADTFERRIYPGVRRLLGSESFPGVDNDPRITVLHAERLGVAGYVSSADGYPRSVHPYSNQREIIYLNLGGLRLGSDSYLSTLAHEFTHLVHESTNPSEDTWIKEGLGHLVPMLVLPELTRGPSAFETSPDLPLLAWTQDGSRSVPVSAQFEAAGQFLLYLSERFGETVLELLVQAPQPGRQGVGELASAGGMSSFADLFADWAAANIVGNQPGLDGRWYREHAPNGLPIRSLSSDLTAESVAQYGADYFEVRGPRLGTVEFTGEPSVTLFPAAPEAETTWYAGGVDGSVASLVSSVDLASALRPRLVYRLWHDLETYYDYVYVLASPDEGQTWTTLEAHGMSRENRSGNNLGVGYTGRSGGGVVPQWTNEEIDLASFGGGRVRLAFVYATDDAIQQAGVAIADPRIETEGAVDAPHWSPTGWTRLSGLLPQRWAVSVIDFLQGPPAIRRLQVDTAGRGALPLRADAARTIVAVSATTPFTSARASYHVRIAGAP
jgi:hypothetical protein